MCLGAYSMRLQPSPGRDSTKLCSAEHEENILVAPAAFGEVRSETALYMLFRPWHDGFASIGSWVGLSRDP